MYTLHMCAGMPTNDAGLQGAWLKVLPPSSKHKSQQVLTVWFFIGRVFYGCPQGVIGSCFTLLCFNPAAQCSMHGTMLAQQLAGKPWPPSPMPAYASDLIVPCLCHFLEAGGQLSTHCQCKRANSHACMLELGLPHNPLEWQTCPCWPTCKWS